MFLLAISFVLAAIAIAKVDKSKRRAVNTRRQTGSRGESINQAMDSGARVKDEYPEQFNLSYETDFNDHKVIKLNGQRFSSPEQVDAIEHYIMTGRASTDLPQVFYSIPDIVLTDFSKKLVLGDELENHREDNTVIKQEASWQRSGFAEQSYELKRVTTPNGQTAIQVGEWLFTMPKTITAIEDYFIDHVVSPDLPKEIAEISPTQLYGQIQRESIQSAPLEAKYEPLPLTGQAGLKDQPKPTSAGDSSTHDYSGYEDTFKMDHYKSQYQSQFKDADDKS